MTTSDGADTYPMPKHGWTCFHCGETFTTPGSARDHFGAHMGATPGCQIKAGEERGLLMALRRAEKELERYRAEDSDADRRHRALVSDHGRELIQAEQCGYDRGLRDARSDAAAALAKTFVGMQR